MAVVFTSGVTHFSDGTMLPVRGRHSLDSRGTGVPPGEMCTLRDATGSPDDATAMPCDDDSEEQRDNDVDFVVARVAVWEKARRMVSVAG